LEQQLLQLGQQQSLTGHGGEGQHDLQQRQSGKQQQQQQASFAAFSIA
jgi:hypothetical protein